MATTNERIIEAANRQSSGENLAGADRQLAEMVNGPALPDLPEDIQGQWAKMPLEERSMALGSLIDERQGGSTGQEERAAESNTGPSRAIPASATPDDEFDDPEGSDIEWDFAFDSTRRRSMSKEAENETVTWASAMESGRKGVEILGTLYKNHFTDAPQVPEESMSSESTQFRQEEAREYRKMGEEKLNDVVIDPLDVADTLESAERLAQAEENMSMDVFHTFLDTVGEGDLAPEVAEDIAGDMALYSVARDAIDGLSVGEQVWDVVRSFSPHASISDNLSIAGEIDAPDFIGKIKDGLDALGPQDREAALRSIYNQFEGRLPEGRRAALISILASPTARQDAEEEFNEFWAIVDTADLVAGFVGIAASGYTAYRGLKAVRNLKSGRKGLGDTIAAAAEAEDSAQALSKIGLDNDSAVETMDPFDAEGLDAQAIDGLSAETQASIRKFEEVARGVGRDINEGRSHLREGWLSDEEIGTIIQNTEATLAKKEGIDNVRTRVEGDTIVAEYTWVDETGEAVPRQDRIELKLDEDTQEIQLADPGIIKRLTTDKGVWAKEDFRTIVQQAERLDNVEATIRTDLQDLWSEALRPVLGKGIKGFVATFTPKQRKKIQLLDEVLIKGDEAGEVYTADQLKSGELGFKVTDEDVIDSYFRVRTVMDNLYNIRNDRKRRELDLRGQKNIELENNNGPAVGKPLSDANAARNSVQTNNPRNIFDDTTGEMVRAADLDIDSLYDQGKALVRLESNTQLGGHDIEVRYSIVDQDSITDLPLRVIPYRAGYVTKINEKVGHVVKEATPRNVDGTVIPANSENAALSAVRFFDSKKEADIWVDNQNRLLREQGISPTTKRFIRHEDQQLEKEHTVGALSDRDSPFGGGLYTGARSTKQILYGTDGTLPPRVNSFEAISRAISATSRYAARNEWRLGLEKRIVKTANQLRSGEHNVTRPVFKTFEDLAGVGVATENDRKIHAMYHAARDWLNFPGTEELVFKQGIQKILDEGGWLSKMPGANKGLHKLKSVDPVGAARSAAFHGLLGFFNPAQLWVQAQGAAVAASMNIFNPKQLGRSLRDQTMLQTLQYMKLTDKNIAHVAKTFKVKPEQLKELKTAFDRTGLADGILATADHAAAAAGYGIDRGAFRHALQRGLFFYTGGELFNRRFSFATAFNEWRAANPKTELTDAALRQISTRANNFMLNMGKARRASWQKGILGLTTQFQQVNMRTLETLVGANGNFTWPERGKIMLGQAALYGAAGVPLASLGASYLMEMGGYNSQLDMEKDLGASTVKWMNEGMLGWLTLQVLGADLEIGERSALLGGTRRLIGDLMFSEGTTAEKIFGAFSNTGMRFWSGLLGQYEPLSLGLAQNRALDPVKVVATPFLSAVSTFRNVDKAIFMHNMNTIADKNWGAITSRDFNPMEEISTAAGFRLTEESTLYKLRARNEAAKSYETKVRNYILKEINKYILLARTDQLSPDYMDTYRTDIAVAMQSLGNERAMLRVQSAIDEKLSDTSTALGREWDAYIEGSANEFSNEAANLQKLFTDPAGQLQGIFMGGDFLREGNFDKEGEQ